MTIYLGRTSDNTTVTRPCAGLPVLFVVYNNESQWHKYLEEFTQHYASALLPQDRVLRVISRYRLENIQGTNFTHWLELEQYLTDLFTRKASRPASHFLIIIDELFQLKITQHKKSARLFSKLLMQGADYGIFLIIGTSGMYKGLLSQLQGWLDNKPARNGGTMLSFAELIINDDDLYFFREAGDINFVRFF
ncbi:hypothetical protein [Flavihumibacter profundi]|uniref:hypothetical protein n=1 Tax=Flavihumibacter profundi TaxID=2716883 RepID=UPI001CC7778E|nr:hypothetical protein [Flavihumibacter profundi]MBZ5857609.1 hypothetical protein [Flavihumibacter profundi]